MYKFAVIEDDSPTNDQFKAYLLKLWPSCTVMQFLTAESALQGIESNDFDLVVSDIDMGPGTDKFGGFKIAKAIDATKCPLLIVSGAPQPEQKREIFQALDAWDYLQKPVTESDFATLVKRGILYRISQTAQSSTECGMHAGVTQDSDLMINRGSKNPVTWKGEPVKLTMTQIYILELLVKKANQAVPFGELFGELISGTNKDNLRMHISDLKSRFKALDESFDRIQSVPMIGYSWRV